MANPQTDRSRHVGVIIAPNRLSVAIRFCDGGDPTPATREEILEALEGHHVAAGPEVVDRVDEFLRLLSSDGVLEEVGDDQANLVLRPGIDPDRAVGRAERQCAALFDVKQHIDGF